MIRIGMNKKSEDPINRSLPFYYTKNGIYTPASIVSLSGSTRSFYNYNSNGKKIIWLESAGDVKTDGIILNTSIKIHIDKNKVINKEDSPCSIISGDTALTCNEFFIEGECSLIYTPNNLNSKTVYILCRDVKIIS